MKFKLGFSIFLYTLLIILIFTIYPSKTKAINYSDFKPGRIIDDSIFTNKDSMSVSQIQSFLNSKVPNCDINHSGFNINLKRYTDSYGREVINTARFEPPFTCINNYREHPTQTYTVYFSYINTNGATVGSSVIKKVNNSHRLQSVTFEYFGNNPANGISKTVARYTGVGGGNIDGGKSAAQIIYDSAQINKINPQVLIATLEKETGLVTDTWAAGWQYDRAMGWACPDSGIGQSANCDTSKEGFMNQVLGSGWQFRNDFDGMDTLNFWSPFGKGLNTIPYNPNTSCGSRNVNIENQATAVLYKYTPYTPNDAAIIAAPGLTVNCGAYGNRNFWRFFNTWFGPSSSIESSFSINIDNQPQGTLPRGQQINYAMTIKNQLNYTLNIDAIGVVGRSLSINNGINRDLGWKGPITIGPYESLKITFTGWTTDIGNLYLWPTILYNNQYIHYENLRSALTIRNANISLESPLYISNNNPVAGEIITLNATVRNNENVPIRTDAIGIPLRYYNKYVYDTGWITPVNNLMQPSGIQQVSGKVLIDKPGPYTAWVSWNMGQIYSPIGQYYSINSSIATPNFSLKYIETPNLQPTAGDNIYLKFKLKNNLNIPIVLDAVGVVGRYENPYTGSNNDFGWIGPVEFSPGEEKIFSTLSKNVSQDKTYYTWVSYVKNGIYTHYNNWGFLINPVKPKISLSGSFIVNDGGEMTFNKLNKFQYKITNNDSKAFTVKTGLKIRYFGKYIYDPESIQNITLQPGGEYTYTAQKFIDKLGPYDTQPYLNINEYELPLKDTVILYPK